MNVRAKYVIIVVLAVLVGAAFVWVTDVPLDLKSGIVVLAILWLGVEGLTWLLRKWNATSTKRRKFLAGLALAMVALVTITIARGVFHRSAAQSEPDAFPSIDEGHPSLALPPSHFTPARSLLVRGSSEDHGYGLYSYVLFRVRPTAQTKSRYVAIVRAIIRRAERTGDLVAAGFNKAELNVFYFPVVRQPTRSASVDEVAEWIVEYYDYARATRISDVVDLSGSDGPFLVASLHPLSTALHQRAAILEDLRRSNDDTAPLWAARFVEVASLPQRWNESSLEAAMLQIREYISLTAAAGEPVIHAVDAIVAWAKPRGLSVSH